MSRVAIHPAAGLLLAVSAALGAGASAAEPRPRFAIRAVDVPAFVSEMHALVDAVRRLNPEDAVPLAAGLPERWLVRDGDVQFDVPSAPIGGALAQAASQPERWPEIRERLVRRLTTIRDEANAARVAPAGDAHASARGELRRILADAEFARLRGDGWREALAARLRRWLGPLLKRLLPDALPGDAIGTVLAWLVAAGAMLAVGMWLFRTRRRPRLGRAPADDAAAAPRLASHDWVARARAGLHEGDIRGAVRCAHRAAIVRFEELGAWRADESRTPREYLNLLPGGDGRRDALAGLTRAFEDAWYGARVPDTSKLWAQLEACGCTVPRD